MSTMLENEMREFFQKVIDSVAELSTQASKVEGLSQQVQRLSERLDNLQTENNDLKTKVGDQAHTIDQINSEVYATRSQLDNEKAVSQSLRDTIVQRDAGVQSLEQSFRQEQDAHRLTTSERDDARTKIAELEQSLTSSKQSYDDVFHDRDNWRQRFWDMEKEAAEVKQQLDKINSVLNPLRVVSQDVQSA